MRKKNSFILLFFIPLFIAFSCNNQNSTEKSIKYDYAYFKSKYPNYYEDTISHPPYKTLVYEYDSLSKQEILLFDTNDNYFEYVFYNISNNEPRYIVYFDSLLNVKKQEGKPIYLASPNFRQEYVKDTFEVNVFLATPPEFDYKFTVFYIDTSGESVEVAEHNIMEDVFTKYIGVTKGSEQKTESYYIISKIWRKNFERIDTVWFEINKL